MMDNTTKPKFRLKTIEEVSFELNDKEYPEEAYENLELDFCVATTINRDNNIINVFVGVKYVIAKKIILKLELINIFHVDNINEIIDIDKEEISFKIDILPILLIPSVGNLRGVLHEKTKHTNFKNYPLPMIDSELLLSKNLFLLEK